MKHEEKSRFLYFFAWRNPFYNLQRGKYIPVGQLNEKSVYEYELFVFNIDEIELFVFIGVENEQFVFNGIENAHLLYPGAWTDVGTRTFRST